MIPKVALGNAPIINAANGNNIHANLPNVDVAVVQSIAAKSVKRMLGFTTDIGVLKLSNDYLFDLNDTNYQKW